MHTQNIFVSILRELKVPFTNSFALLAYEEHPFSKKQIMYKQIMYIRQVTFLIMLCSSVMAFAQKAYLSVTVNPIDAITESTLTQARVSLLSTIDSTEVDTFRRITILGDVIKRYTYVYDNSHATLPFKRIVRVESEGYETLYYDLNILPSEVKHGEVAHNIGVIRLHRERSHNLNEATVTASRIMMVMKGDTLVYDANAFQLAEGSMLDELIRQLPGVRLESGGRITVNGHFVSSLLVNGKDFFNGDPKVALQNLPAYMVNKVKTYQKTPDDAYLTRSPDEKGPHMDDPWVLDVALKPQYAQSYIANAELAHSVYQSKPMLARLFGLRFSDKSRIALYATGNNVNMSGSPQTDSGNWEENMKKEGMTKMAEAGAFYFVENRNRNIRYHSTIKTGMDDGNLERFTSATSFLPEINSSYTTSFEKRRNKNTYVNWSNGFTFALPKTYIRFSPSFSYSYDRRHGYYHSAEGNRLLGREGLDSIIIANACGEDFLNLLFTQDIGRTHKWGTSGNADTRISLKALHMNTLGLQAHYKYSHERGYDMQHYKLLAAGGTADMRNRYDNRPGSSYMYRIIADYPIIDISGVRKKSKLYFTYRYTQEFSSSERMLYRLDKLGDEWMPDEAAIGLLPSAADLYAHCVDSLNSYHRTHFYRCNSAELRWYYRTENLQVSTRIPLNITYERLNEWRPKTTQPHIRKEIYTWPRITFELKGVELNFSMQHKSPSQTLMLDVCDDSNPLSVFLGNPSLKSSYEYYCSVQWRGFKQKKMRQWNLGLYLHTIDNAIGQLRQFNPQNGGYIYMPWNIDGNRGLRATGIISQSVDKEKHWFLNIGTNVSLNRSVDFANTKTTADFYKSIVHNLHVSPNAGIDYRYSKWHASFKASADWERLTSAQEGFETLSQVDFLYTISLNAPLLFSIDLNTDMNLFMRRGYSNRAMNTDEWGWNVNLSRCIDKRKAWLLKLSAHDLLGQLSAVRRTLNAQGRVETVNNTITRNIILHIIWKFNKKASKK